MYFSLNTFIIGFIYIYTWILPFRGIRARELVGFVVWDEKDFLFLRLYEPATQKHGKSFSRIISMNYYYYWEIYVYYYLCR